MGHAHKTCPLYTSTGICCSPCPHVPHYGCRGAKDFVVEARTSSEASVFRHFLCCSQGLCMHLKRKVELWHHCLSKYLYPLYTWKCKAIVFNFIHKKCAFSGNKTPYPCGRKACVDMPEFVYNGLLSHQILCPKGEKSLRSQTVLWNRLCGVFYIPVEYPVSLGQRSERYISVLAWNATKADMKNITT